MKVLIQRVSRARVTVSGSVVGQIGKGLLVFLGVEHGDGDADVDYMVDKTAGLRIFPDPEGWMNLSVVESSGAVLVVSQFTLAASTRRGRRPSFTAAAEPGEAERLYERFAHRLAEKGIPVEKGEFQALMDVELVNDGPVTILLDPRPGRE